MVELIALLNSVIKFLSIMTLFRWLIFLLRFLTVTVKVLVFLFVYFLWCYYLFYSGFPSIGKFWSCCFHWLFIKLTMGCPVSSHSIWLFLCWLGWLLWSFERCSMGGYLEIFGETDFSRGFGGEGLWFPLMGPGQSPGGVQAAKLPEAPMI